MPNPRGTPENLEPGKRKGDEPLTEYLHLRVTKEMKEEVKAQDEKDTKIVRTPGGDQQMLCINESGFYSLVLTSRKAQAKRFKKWITSEVIPAIRKTGSYSVAPKQVSGIDTQLAELRSKVEHQ